ncbi:uracil-DNA glycosylase family protein [Pseudarcicella hirudinis]|uniref:uracil-DNA glycosylase family protein n=1 Tax=Pseudarcicella hirudinis TaxID=1079859 RepID=UPI0035E5C703
MDQLLEQIKSCRVCENYLALGANPVVTASAKSRIVIIGQAPGKIVHNTRIPWNDKSGDNLRQWLGIDKSVFYDTDLFALMPMGFCYPGKDKTGDLPPRPECAPLWHGKLLAFMSDVKLILLIGQYAQNYYLRDRTNVLSLKLFSIFSIIYLNIFPFLILRPEIISGRLKMNGLGKRFCLN